MTPVVVRPADGWPQRPGGANKTVQEMTTEERTTILRPLLAAMLAQLPAEEQVPLDEVEAAVLDGRLELGTRAFEAPVFTYEVPGFAPVHWDITFAIAEAEAGHVVATVAIEPEHMAAIRAGNAWDAAKLDTVDPTIPGIGAPIIIEGKVIYILIDGTHRCVRCLRDGLPFHARLLTDEAARRCVLSGPAALLPWG